MLAKREAVQAEPGDALGREGSGSVGRGSSIESWLQEPDFSGVALEERAAFGTIRLAKHDPTKMVDDLLAVSQVRGRRRRAVIFS